MSRSADSRLPAAETVHLVIGVAAVLVFLGTGLYMNRFLGHLQGMEGTSRMLYRSTHLYILYAGLINGLVGIGWKAYSYRPAILLRSVGSLLLLTLPMLLVLAFFIEPGLTGLARPFTTPATYAALSGGALLFLAHGLNTARARSAAG